MLVGNMMRPEPIMFTATMNVSWTRFIFFCSCIPLLLRDPLRESLPNHVSMELYATVHLLLEDALHFVVEAGEAVERFLEGQEIIEHRPCSLVPAFAGNHHPDAGRVDQRQGRRDTVLDPLIERHIVHLVRDQGLVGVLRRHRELREARGAEALLL